MNRQTELRSYSRDVAPLDWWFLASPRGEYPVVQLAVEGFGGLSGQLLTEALALAADACPGSRLRRLKKVWVDSGRPPRVVTAPRTAADAVLDSPLLHSPLPARSDDTCEVVLFEGDPATLVFRAFHGVMDGRGVQLWAEDVFRALRGEQPVGAPSRMNAQDMLATLDRDLREGLPPLAGKPVLQWPQSFARPQRGPRVPVFRRRSIDGAHPAMAARVAVALAAACPRSAGTSHGAPQGATVRTGDDTPAGTDARQLSRFSVVVDGRRHVPGARTTADLALSVPLDVYEGEAWEEVQARLLTALGERQDLAQRTDPALRKLPKWLVRGLERAADAATGPGLYGSAAVLSDLGTVACVDYSCPGFDAQAVYMLGSPGIASPAEVDTVVCGNRTEVTVAWWDGPETKARADALLDDIEEALAPRAHREWDGNRTRTSTGGPSVVRMFREQVERTPDRIAVSGPDGDLTYAELSRWADAIAAELRLRGVERESVVGVLADRSPHFVAAVWGVLRAGAAYLPLDPRNPDARLRELLTDASAKYCLVQQHHAERRWCPPGCEPLLLSDLSPTAEPTATDHRDAEPDPHDLAFVIYTSGSTGKPKGVQIEHRALHTYLTWALREFGVDQEIRLPLITSPAFDLTVRSVFLPLLAGGAVLPLREEPDPLSLRALLTGSGATMLSGTPSHLDLISRLDLDLRDSGIRTVVVAGELLRVPVALRAQEMFGPQCRIINLYGPTETTVECTLHVFDKERDAGRAAVFIGRPTDNTTIHLLDPSGRFVAPGETGEIHLGGDQLARGYLGRPDLTREKFFRLADGTRVYRSGDLARLTPTGELEFMGRSDHQVKIRGHRVEPAEVAATFERHPRVRTAVVVPGVRPGGHTALLGYAVADPDVTGEQLRRFAAARLPEYLVPWSVTVLAELPLTVNGKVDVRALPSCGPEGAFADGPGSAQPALDSVESAVADVWADALQVNRSALTARDNFHRLGGDSLTLYAMLATVCRQVLGAGREQAFMSQLARILREPTLREIALVVRETAGPDPENRPAA
ncbi:amino acid adenylation domain-containing protein [Streptomyces hayashii]|uniref:amino acid adenylation domain-containing protein n=1 Tax=Streptomyces hayashii TaxID=2839966 RepID=UPI00403C4536